jgi:hypothetical protein
VQEKLFLTKRRPKCEKLNSLYHSAMLKFLSLPDSSSLEQILILFGGLMTPTIILALFVSALADCSNVLAVVVKLLRGIFCFLIFSFSDHSVLVKFDKTM